MHPGDPIKPGSLEFVTTRLIPASSARIARAFTDPTHLARWWGPKGFSNTIHEFDLSPGGKWRLDMHGPDGKNYPNESVFEEVSAECIVFRHLGSVHQFQMTMNWVPESDGTRLNWRMAFADAKHYRRAQQYVPRCNEENFDRLEAELARIPEENSDGRELVLTRIIDAPHEKLFQAWTDPDLLKQWFAPRPNTTPVAELDTRPGGSSTIVMRGEDGSEMPLHGVYLEVVENQRIVTTDAYTSAWVSSDKPFVTIIVTFGDLGGRTRYTARVRHWTTADREAHENMGFYEGWGQCTDQLAALVENSTGDKNPQPKQ